MSEPIYDFKNCPFTKICHRQCDTKCSLIAEFDFLVRSSELPKKYTKPVTLYPEDEDVDSFYTLQTIKEDILNFVSKGRILYLYGNYGVGKSSWASKIMLTYFSLVSFGNCFTKRGKFVFVPSFLLSQKDFNDDTRMSRINEITECELVVFDDIGAASASKYDLSLLVPMIDKRISNSKCTIFTSNVNPNGLAELIGTRSSERACSDIVIELKGTSQRAYNSTYTKGE